jgi:hypothetical protein
MSLRVLGANSERGGGAGAAIDTSTRLRDDLPRAVALSWHLLTSTVGRLLTLRVNRLKETRAVTNRVASEVPLGHTPAHVHHHRRRAVQGRAMRIAAGLLVVAVLVAPLAAQREPPDVAQLRMRAEQGEPIEQFLLGAVYAQGSGVSRDYVEALRWFRLAAAQGVPEASHNIGVMYANGQGVPQNDAQAYFWFNLATAGDLDAAQRERTMAAMERAAAGLALERQAAIRQLATRCVDAGFTACQEPE